MSDPVFFAPSRHFSAAEIATLTGASLANPADSGVTVTSIAPVAVGGDGTLVFVDGKRNAGGLANLQAAAVLCTPDVAAIAPAGIAVLVAAKPHQAFAQVARLLYPGAARPTPITAETGISPHAHVDPSARIEAGAIVEAGAVVGANASIGSGTIIAPNAIIGPSCQIGRGCYVGAAATVLCAFIGNNVVIHSGVRIGQDGFGYVPGARGLEKMPQIGRVVIQDNVEIGANTTIDRGAMADTVIGENSKIDNLVQIAHNVRVGRNCIIAGQCGISGSVTIGDGVLVGGGVGLADHVTVGAGAQLAARGGFMNDVPAGEVWGGFPAQPMSIFFREVATLRRLVKSRSAKG